MKYSIVRYGALSREVQRCRQDYITMGPTPHEETCTPCGYDRLEDGIIECTAYINQLIRAYGPVPPGGSWVIMENDHETGIYYEATLVYEQVIYAAEEGAEDFEPLSYTYMQKIEAGLDHWDPEAIAELREGEHHLHTAKVIKLKRA